MPSLPDSIFLFVLALLLFGPKRLPMLARELGKWVGEFRRASNEFKMQMEDELRLSEQAERNKQIAALEAAAPTAPPIDATQIDTPQIDIPQIDAPPIPAAENPTPQPETQPETQPNPQPTYELLDGVRTPLPIATSGDLKIMPPTTGLPTARTSSPLDNLLNAIPEAIPEATPPEAAPTSETATETTAHGH